MRSRNSALQLRSIDTDCARSSPRGGWPRFQIVHILLPGLWSWSDPGTPPFTQNYALVGGLGSYRQSDAHRGLCLQAGFFDIDRDAVMLRASIIFRG